MMRKWYGVLCGTVWVMLFAVLLLPCRVSAQQGEASVTLNWTYHPYWYALGEENDSFVLKVNNPNQGGRYIYSQEKLTGKRSFCYEVTMEAPVNDANAAANGWDRLDLYLAINGEPDTNQDFDGYPAYKDETDAVKRYDCFFISIKRYPESQPARAVLCKIADQQLEELDNYELTAAQRENDHNLQFRIEYQYASDDRNELTVELDGVKIFTLQNCEELLQGALGFGPVLVNMSVTELSLVYTDAVPPETETPETGDAPSSAAAAAILCGAVMLFTVLSPGKRRRFN